MRYYNSPFNIVFSSKKKRQSIVHNLMTGTVYTFREYWNTILDAANRNRKLANELAKHSLVTESADYITNVKNYFQLKDATKRMFFYFTVTTRCELQCKYCFQNNIKRQDSSIKTIYQFGHWLREYLNLFAMNFDEISLVLFGGDPVIRFDLSCILLKMVSEICHSFSLKLRSIMTTSGTIGDTKVLNELAKSGLKTVQVSFDGPRSLHNLTRPGTYDTILSNLSKFQQYFHLRIKYNISKTNSEVNYFKEFLDDLEKQKMAKDYIIVLETLQETTTNVGSKSGCWDYNDKTLGGIFTKFADLANKRGFRVNLKAAFQPPCMFTSNNGYMIDTNGDIMNCDTAYNIRDFRIGNIFETPLIKLSKDKNRGIIFKLVKRMCAKKKCQYFPLCETGCYFYRYVKNMSFNDSVCREAYIRSFFPALTRLLKRK